MKRLFLISLLLAIVASLFASSNPDGLEKVSQSLGFISIATQTHSILPSYNSFYGIAGVLITFLLFCLVVYLFGRSSVSYTPKEGIKSERVFIRPQL